MRILALLLLAGAVPVLSAPPAPARKPAAKPSTPPAPKPRSRPATAPKPISAPKDPPSAKPAPSAAPRAAEKEPPYQARGPIDFLDLQRGGRVKISHSPQDGGGVNAAFDGNRTTAVRGAEKGTAFVQVTLDRPQRVDEIDVLFPGEGTVNWTVLAANSEADLKARKGSFAALVPSRAAQGGQGDQAVCGGGYRIFRLEYTRVGSEVPAELAEWEVWGLQSLARIGVEAFTPVVAVGGKLQLRADGIFDVGARENLTPEVRWEVSPPERGKVDELSRLEGLGAGPVQVSAVYQGVRSAPLAVEVLAEGKPDWDVTFIERQPRIDEAPDGGVKVGQNVYWFGHIKNYGTAAAREVSVEWRVDGNVALAGKLPKLERFSQTEVILRLPWDGKRHTLELVVDDRGEVSETSEENNRLTIFSDAQPVGFWVEDSALRHFHRHQARLGLGSNSWEDWAQRQIRALNQQSEASPGPSPAERPAWRLDRIVVVGDGMLPMAGGSATRTPDQRVRSVRAQWGFPAVDVTRSGLYQKFDDPSAANPFVVQAELVRALAELR